MQSANHENWNHSGPPHPPPWDMSHLCLCLPPSAFGQWLTPVCLSSSGQRGAPHPYSPLTESPIQRGWGAVAVSVWETDVAEVGISFLHRSLPASPRAPVNEAGSRKGSLAITSLALALLPTFTFPLGGYDSHACSVLPLPSPSYSPGTRVTQPVTLLPAGKITLVTTWRGLQLLSFSRAEEEGGEAMRDLHSCAAGLAVHSSMACFAAHLCLSFGCVVLGLFFFCLFWFLVFGCFFLPARQIASWCMLGLFVCLIVCFLNRKYSVKDDEEHGENESVNHWNKRNVLSKAEVFTDVCKQTLLSIIIES